MAGRNHTIVGHQNLIRHQYTDTHLQQERENKYVKCETIVFMYQCIGLNLQQCQVTM